MNKNALAVQLFGLWAAKPPEDLGDGRISFPTLPDLDAPHGLFQEIAAEWVALNQDRLKVMAKEKAEREEKARLAEEKLAMEQDLTRILGGKVVSFEKIGQSEHGCRICSGEEAENCHKKLVLYLDNGLKLTVEATACGYEVDGSAVDYAVESINPVID